jgi:hypothetical protein
MNTTKMVLTGYIVVCLGVFTICLGAIIKAAIVLGF